MKVIFLDIDGVLNGDADFAEVTAYGHPHNKVTEIELPSGYKKEFLQVISPGKLALVEYIIKNTDAKIVISSHWRHFYTNNEIYEMFKNRGFTFPRTIVVGKTPDKRRGISSGPEYFRQTEILTWLEEHTSEIKSFVVLDDLSKDRWFTDERIHDNVVQTDLSYGLNYSKATKAIEILGRNEESQKLEDEHNAALDILMYTI